jgi:hypothetical protein
MSVSVELDRLTEEIARFGATAYLLTVTDDATPHATAVTVTRHGGALRAGVGNRSAANVAARPSVTLLWPPVEIGGFTLLVDGTATVDGEEAVITPGRAVLHRQRQDGPGSDCVRLTP